MREQFSDAAGRLRRQALEDVLHVRVEAAAFPGPVAQPEISEEM